MRRVLPPLLLVAALASCGGDDEPTTAQSPPTTTESGGGDCGTQGAYAVKVVNGEVPCDLARRTVAGYDPGGAKVQEVGAYTCEGGEAAARPIVFTCVVGDNEITASEP